LNKQESSDSVFVQPEGQAIDPNHQAIIDLFHKLYYHSGKQTWKNTFFLGIPILKCPLDLWIYQEILVQNKPDIIIETGTFCRGSALYLAFICDLLGQGRVITIDVENRAEGIKHPRISFLQGSSTSPALVRQIKDQIGPKDKVMVLLDSEHKQEHVLKELQLYHSLVSPGQYLIVEDTNVNGHPVYQEFGPGPMEALEMFLAKNDQFEVDRQCEKFFLTMNPRGFLKRIP